MWVGGGGGGACRTNNCPRAGKSESMLDGEAAISQKQRHIFGKSGIQACIHPTLTNNNFLVERSFKHLTTDHLTCPEINFFFFYVPLSENMENGPQYQH